MRNLHTLQYLQNCLRILSSALGASAVVEEKDMTMVASPEALVADLNRASDELRVRLNKVLRKEDTGANEHGALRDEVTMLQARRDMLREQINEVKAQRKAGKEHLKSTIAAVQEEMQQRH